MAASASSLPDVGEGGLVVVDISKFTAVKIFDKRSSPSGSSTGASSSRCGCLQICGKGADGTSSYPKVRDRTCTKETSRYIEGKKAKAFGRVNAQSRQLSVYYDGHYKEDEDEDERLHWSDITEASGWPHANTWYDPWSD